MIVLKRVYEPPQAGDGVRILVDRLWPRGLSKEKARIDEWMKEVAPSAGLRRWFGHVPARWPVFKRKYRSELGEKKGLLRELRGIERAKKRITLVYGAKDEKHNHAIVLLSVLKSM